MTIKTINQFGKILKKLVSKKNNIHEVLNLVDRTIDNLPKDSTSDFFQLLLTLSGMRFEESFFLNYAELNKIAEDVISGKFHKQSDNKIQTEYVKFDREFFEGQEQYLKREQNGDLMLLTYMVFSINPQELFEKISNKRGIKGNMIDINIDYKNNSVILFSKIPFHANEEFTIDIENFKKMVEDWKNLYDQKVPTIYFIRGKAREIFVRERLEE